MNRRLQLTVFLFAAGITEMTAQCLTLTCPGDITQNNTTGLCGANVSFSAPNAVTTCVGTVRDTFFFTGAPQTFTVPIGISMLTIETWGAQGGANWVNNVNYGGYVKGDYPVTGGEVLTVYVGGQPTGITGGYNGGGNGEGAGKGGGGASDVRQGGTTYNNRIIVAGGGGGAGYWSNLHVVGGVGGGLVGGDGYRNTIADPGGQGGTQTSSGTGTCINFNVPAMAGGFGFGGSPSGCGCEGYGGGGGWWGGAGSGNCRGGGGGSGHVTISATNTSMSSGVRVGNGMVIISIPSGSSIPVVTQTAGLPSGSFFPVGITTNTFTATDGFGNSATCSFLVTVNDSDRPVISAVPSNISVGNDAGLCSAIVNWNTPVVTDNCSATLQSSHNSGDMFPVGTTTVTYLATDASGNMDTVTFQVMVNDTERPAITAVPLNIVTANDAGQCNAIVSWTAPVATDNCSATLTSTFNSGDVFPAGTTTVWYIATDPAGNVDSASFQVTVNDTEVPVITCSGNTTLATDSGQCTVSSSSLIIATGTDNCSAVTITNDAPQTLPAGVTTVTWTATDSSGNTSTCTQQVTVQDLEAPAFSVCPNDISICPGVVTFANAEATDNCSAVTVTQTSGPSSGSSLTAGGYTVVYTATDSSGNTSTCSFTITVNPNPTVSVAFGNQANVCVDDGAFQLAGGNPAGGTWSGNGVNAGMFTPAVAGTGAQTISYQYVDVNGCSATATGIITVSACVGISENGLQVFSMYPNPVSGSGSFMFSSIENGTLELTDMNGKVLQRERIAAGRQDIQLANVAPGTYLVRFVTAKGNVATSRLQVH